MIIPSSLHMVQLFLEGEGMPVQWAVSGEEALWKLKENNFGLMITDLKMPGIDGFELARKAAAIAPFMPIVMFTGDISPDILAEALEAGIKTVLAKPFYPNEILEAVKLAGKRENTFMKDNNLLA